VNYSVRVMKRTMDLLFCGVGMIVVLPVMLCVAVTIKITSKGPVFYKQKRAGFLPADHLAEPREFWVYKFRTMIENAEKNTGAVLCSKGDLRVTKVGKILRKTRLDELPQFFNVLKGEMSLVGPRPERPELMKIFSEAIPFFEERMRLVKPGITGLAQVNLSYSGRLSKDDKLFHLKDSLFDPFGLPETVDSLGGDMRTKMLYDMAYSCSLERFSSALVTDLKTIAATPVVMFLKRTG